MAQIIISDVPKGLPPEFVRKALEGLKLEGEKRSECLSGLIFCSPDQDDQDDCDCYLVKPEKVLEALRMKGSKMAVDWLEGYLGKSSCQVIIFRTGVCSPV